MAKLTLTDITSGYQVASTTNANYAAIEAALENTLSRDGTTPNTMSANLDMNSNKVVNLTDGANNQDAVTVAQLNAASVVANTIAGSAVTIADSGGYFDGTTAEGVLQEIGAEYVTRTAPTESVTTTNVITAAESGTTFFLNLAGGFTSTLPAPATGLNYKFIVATAPRS